MMNTILCIETSTRPCSVALIHQSKILFHKEEMNGPSHASLLGLFVKEAMECAKTQKVNLEAVAVSCGPGSYTGLRIGVALAKGLCFGLHIPLIPIQTLQLLAVTARQQLQLLSEPQGLICPMIDARRMEVYAAIYDENMKEVKKVSADIIDETSYAEYRCGQTFYICGDGAEKCTGVLPDVHCITNIVPLAVNMQPLVEKAIEKGEIINDPAYFEPFYLKEFVATVSKKNLLG